MFSLSPVPAPGVVSVSVSSITASSISLSWSVASGSVASWEVVWRETDRGTESSSGSLTGTSYTIDQLESTTIYTVTVRASNVAGTTDSQPITFSTGECVSPASSIIAAFFQLQHLMFARQRVLPLHVLSVLPLHVLSLTTQQESLVEL